MTIRTRWRAGVVSLLLLCAAAPQGAPSPQGLVDASTKVVAAIKANHKYAKELRTSEGLLILSHAQPGGSIPAVLLKHDSDGLWSPPAFLTVSPLPSAGPTSGGKGGGALLLMTSKALEDFSRPRFTFDHGANLAVVTFDSEKGQPMGEGDVEFWSTALAGVTLVGVTFAEDASLNKAYYGRDVAMSDILTGKVQNKAAATLRKSLPL